MELLPLELSLGVKKVPITIHQGLPSTDFFLLTSAHHPGMKSRNLSLWWYLGDHFFIIGGFPRGCSWFSLLITTQSISLMFDLKFIYSHGTKRTRFDEVEDPGISGDYIVIISPPRLRLELFISDTCVHLHHRSIVYLVMAMVIVLLQIHTVCLVAAVVVIHFIMDPQCISRGHDLVNGVLHGVAMYCWQLCLVIISEFISPTAKGHFWYRD